MASKVTPFKYTLILLFIINNFTLQNLPHRVNNETSTLPTHKINLDLPVRERYRDLLISNKEQVKAFAFFTSYAPLAYLVSKYGSYLLNKSTQDPEWFEYIEAVSDLCEISLNDAVMLSVTYDMACTSTIIQDSNNNIFMGRNLDFDTYYVIGRLMFEAEYFKQGQFLYRGVELVGYRGAINAVKPGMFSTSLNLRHGTSRLSNLFRIFRGFPTPGFHLMKVMEKANSYEEAKDMLSLRKISAPVFYIVAGVNKNEGAVISRNYDGVYNLNKLDVDQGKWFIAICNVDFDKDESEEDFRRAPAEDNIKNIGRDFINYENLFNSVMAVYPNNNFLTAYTTIQSAQNEGYFNTTLWLP